MVTIGLGGAVDTFIGSVSNPKSVLGIGTHVLSKSRDLLVTKKSSDNEEKTGESVGLEGIEFTRLDK